MLTPPPPPPHRNSYTGFIGGALISAIICVHACKHARVPPVIPLRKFNRLLLSCGGWCLRRTNHGWAGHRGSGHFRFGCGQHLQGAVTQIFHLMHDPFTVEVGGKDVWKFLHQYVCHLHCTNHCSEVRGLEHHGYVTRGGGREREDLSIMVM